MIDFERKLVFLHLPKTGGTSIEACLLGDNRLDFFSGSKRSRLMMGQYRKNFLGLPHPHANLEEHLVGLGDIESDFKFFTVIRNPYAVAFSRFIYQFRYKPSSFYTVKNFKLALKALPTKFSKNYERLIGSKGELRLDYIINFQHLQSEFEAMFLDLGLEPVELGHLNKDRTNTMHYFNFYDDEAIELVQDYYSYEIERFGWELNLTSVRPILFKNLSHERQNKLNARLLKRQRKGLLQRIYTIFAIRIGKHLPSELWGRLDYWFVLLSFSLKAIVWRLKSRK